MLSYRFLHNFIARPALSSGILRRTGGQTAVNDLPIASSGGSFASPLSIVAIFDCNRVGITVTLVVKVILTGREIVTSETIIASIRRRILATDFCMTHCFQSAE